MRFLNTVYVTEHRAKLGVKGMALEVRVDRALTGRFPLEATEAVVLAGAAGMTTEAIGRCVRRGITVSSLHGSGSVRFVVRGATSGNVMLRVGQMRCADDPDRSLAVARAVVAGKLQNCRRALLRWAADAPQHDRRHLDDQRAVVEERMSSVSAAIDGDQLRGIEGDATRRYFKGMGAQLGRTAPGFAFMRRERRPPRDPVNALMGYCYGLLTVACEGAADAAGLDPQIGFLHGLRPGRPALALDLIEELRPALADRFVVTTFGRRQLSPDEFQMTAGGACYLTDDGRKRVLSLWEQFKSVEVEHPLLRQAVPRSALPVIQATLMARHIRGDLPVYAPFVG